MKHELCALTMGNHQFLCICQDSKALAPALRGDGAMAQRVANRLARIASSSLEDVCFMYVFLLMWAKQ